MLRDKPKVKADATEEIRKKFFIRGLRRGGWKEGRTREHYSY
jgi:hypothetical protein